VRPWDDAADTGHRNNLTRPLELLRTLLMERVICWLREVAESRHSVCGRLEGRARYMGQKPQHFFTSSSSSSAHSDPAPRPFVSIAARSQKLGERGPGARQLEDVPSCSWQLRSGDPAALSSPRFPNSNIASLIIRIREVQTNKNHHCTAILNKSYRIIAIGYRRFQKTRRKARQRWFLRLGCKVDVCFHRRRFSTSPSEGKRERSCRSLP
jgi:hypothetical protein